MYFSNLVNEIQNYLEKSNSDIYAIDEEIDDVESEAGGFALFSKTEPQGSHY